MTVDLKRGVNPNIAIDFAIALGWVKSLWEQFGFGPFVITSLKDSHHSSRSKHKQWAPKDVPGLAADIRTRHLFHGSGHDSRLIEFARRLQQEGFGVVIHPDWLRGDPHLHFHKKKPIFRRVK